MIKKSGVSAGFPLLFLSHYYIRDTFRHKQKQHMHICIPTYMSPLYFPFAVYISVFIIMYFFISKRKSSEYFEYENFFAKKCSQSFNYFLNIHASSGQ
jgi:hypothetical protein